MGEPAEINGLRLNRAISANVGAARFYADELQTLADAARLMGHDRLRDALMEIARGVQADAEQLQRIYSEELSAEVDASLAAFGETINAALGVRSKPGASS